MGAAVIQTEAEVPGIVDVFDIGETDDGRPSNLLLRSDRGVTAASSRLLRRGERLLVGDLGLAKDATLDTTALSIGAARLLMAQTSTDRAGSRVHRNPRPGRRHVVLDFAKRRTNR